MAQAMVTIVAILALAHFLFPLRRVKSWVWSTRLKILFTADLHYHRPWFDWLLQIANRLDLVCLGGDLVDMNHPSGFIPQLIFLYEWVQSFIKSQTQLAICSGNHDLPLNTPLLPPGISIRKDKLAILGDLARQKSWIHALKLNHLVSVDGDTRIIRSRSGEAITISCFPYQADGHVKSPLEVAAPWLVLHHEPPFQTRIAAPKSGNREFAMLVTRRQPAWTFSGHVHYTDGIEDQFFQRIGETICYNCRQIPLNRSPLPPEPNHIILDTKSGSSTWHHSIPEQKVA